VYVSATTLILVPATILNQWRQELELVPPPFSLSLSLSSHFCSLINPSLFTFFLFLFFFKHPILSVLVVDKKIPKPKELIRYDVVLMNHNKFGTISFFFLFFFFLFCFLLNFFIYYIYPHVTMLTNKNKKGNETGYMFTENVFYSVSSHSPLLRVHWLRLIVDEGHILGSTTTSIYFLHFNFMLILL
jgi:SNF2 family DNA or RNA helicase